MQEQNWTYVPEFENLYEINEAGIIRSLHPKNYHKIIESRIDRGGYYSVRLSKGGQTVTRFVHRLLATVFIANTDNKKYVNHKNGNKLDNTLHNLEWCTHKENVIDAYKQGLNSCAKRIVDTLSGNIYYSIREAANALGINYNTCCKRLKRNCPYLPLRYVG